MAFITWNDSLLANPYTVCPDETGRGSLQLAHPSATDVLVLSTFDGEPYSRYYTNWYKADGRSVQGALRIVGGTPDPQRWECNFVCSLAQLDLFHELLGLQKTSLIPVSLNDRWIPGRSYDTNVFVGVDDRYVTPLGREHFQRLQFTLEEV